MITDNRIKKSIISIISSWGRYNIQPWYQRKEAWFKSGRIKLIENILKGWTFPEIFLHITEAGYNVFDGQQRLTTLMMFRFGELRLSKGFSVDDYDLSNFRFSDLPESLKKRFNKHIVHCCVCEGPEDEIVELFRDLQKGQPLNAQEQRNAHKCAMRDYIYSELVKHPLFPSLVNISITRDNHARLASEFVRLTEAGTYTGIGGKAVNKMYSSHLSDETVLPHIKKTYQGLNLMMKAFPDAIKNMPKNEIIAAFCLVMYLNNHYKFSAVYKLLEPWLLQFRIDRKNKTVIYNVEDPALQVAANEAFSYDWSAYNLATNNASASAPSIEKRAITLIEHFEATHDIEQHRVIAKCATTW